MLIVRITFRILYSFVYCVLLGNLGADIYESKFATISGSASLKAAYDSRLFGVSSTTFAESQKATPSSGVSADDLKSEDDFVLTFSPALHFRSKFGLIKISGSAGIGVTRYIKNHTKYIITAIII